MSELKHWLTKMLRTSGRPHHPAGLLALLAVLLAHAALAPAGVSADQTRVCYNQHKYTGVGSCGNKLSDLVRTLCALSGVNKRSTYSEYCFYLFILSAKSLVPFFFWNINFL